MSIEDFRFSTFLLTEEEIRRKVTLGLMKGSGSAENPFVFNDISSLPGEISLSGLSSHLLIDKGLFDRIHIKWSQNITIKNSTMVFISLDYSTNINIINSAFYSLYLNQSRGNIYKNNSCTPAVQSVIEKKGDIFPYGEIFFLLSLSIMLGMLLCLLSVSVKHIGYFFLFLVVVLFILGIIFFSSRKSIPIIRYYLLIRNRKDTKKNNEFNLPNALNSDFKGDSKEVAIYHAYKEDYHKAIEAMNRVREIEIGNPIFWRNLSMFYLKINDFDEAISTSKKSISIDPKFKSAYLVLGRAYLEKGNIQKAQEIHEQIYQMDPNLKDNFDFELKIIAKKEKELEGTEYAKYLDIPLRFDQKEFLVELEKLLNHPITPISKVNIDSKFGFSSQAGFIIGLNLHHRFNLAYLPESIGNLKYLKKLSFSDCFKITKLPDNFVKLVNLEELCFKHDEHAFTHPNQSILPISLDQKICQLKNIKKLDISNSSSITNLPECLGELPYLQKIIINNCNNLKKIPKKILDSFYESSTLPNRVLIRKKPKTGI